MTTVAIDVYRVVHALSENLQGFGTGRTKCGVGFWWKHRLSWWSPVAMEEESRLIRPVDCMACLVKETQ